MAQVHITDLFLVDYTCPLTYKTLLMEIPIDPTLGFLQVSSHRQTISLVFG